MGKNEKTLALWGREEDVMGQQQTFQWKKLELGTCYYPEHWDKSLWEQDLERMLEHGITTIRVGEFAWNLTEPEEGVFTFDFWDGFFDLVEKKGMKVIFGTPTATPPAWLTERYPEVLNARRDGTLYRHGMRRHYNYNSKIYQQLSCRIVERLGQHYGKRPCIVGWQIDNELNCETDEFYSESDTLAFREFLQEKYGTLEELNKAWGTLFWNQTYTAWEQVYVPRPAIYDGTNPHQHLDYLRFVSESAIRFCRMQRDILVRYRKPGDFITTNGLFPSLDNHRMARECLDVYTYDSYPNFAYDVDADPKHDKNLKDRKWSRNLMEVRSICPHFGIMEQQSGAGGWNNRMEAPAPKPGQMMLWAMQSIAHGADYISFFRWRTAVFGTEMYWHGLLDYDNRPNRKLAELRQIHARVEAIQEAAGADYVAPLGLLKDYDNVFDVKVDNWHRRVSTPSETEIFVAAQLAHTPLDAVYLTEATTLEELLAYPVLIYPHGEILTSQRAQLLEAYVRAGGTLVLGARTGQKDAHGQCVMQPMPGLLADLTQTAVKEFTLLGPGDDPVPMEWEGHLLPTGVFNDVLEGMGEDAKVLARYGGSAYYAGEPALVETKAGEGKVLHFGGTFTRELVDALLEYTGIREPFEELAQIPAACEIALRRKEGEEYLFVLNYSKEPQELVLKQPMVDLDNRCASQGPVVLGSYETKVYRVQR